MYNFYKMRYADLATSSYFISVKGFCDISAHIISGP